MCLYVPYLGACVPRVLKYLPPHVQQSHTFNTHRCIDPGEHPDHRHRERCTRPLMLVFGSCLVTCRLWLRDPNGAHVTSHLTHIEGSLLLHATHVPSDIVLRWTWHCDEIFFSCALCDFLFQIYFFSLSFKENFTNKNTSGHVWQLFAIQTDASHVMISAAGQYLPRPSTHTRTHYMAHAFVCRLVLVANTMTDTGDNKV